MTNLTTFFIERSFEAMGYRIWISERNHKRRWVAKQLVMEEVEAGNMPMPTMSISESEAQQLMDALYSAGIRPSDARSSELVYEAQNAHIQDLQRVTFTLLNKNSDAD